jgi:hypothetical protein
MLDKKSKQVLKALNKGKNDIDYIEKSEILLKYLPKTYSVHNLDNVLWHLQDLKYVVCSPGGDTIYVTYKAQNYKEFDWIEFKLFLTRSIFLPIGVSAITALITVGITNLLKK